MSDSVGMPDSKEKSDAAKWVDSVMSRMTLEEMAGQLLMPAVYSDADESSMRRLARYAADCHIGGVVLLKGTTDAARAIADTLTGRLAVVPFVAIDAEWGLAMRLDDTPRYPRNGKISPRAEEELLYDYGYEVAREGRAAGINMVLGPVLDVISPQAPERGGVIGSRSFGSNPQRVARLGTAYARGLEDGGAISVAKHFPGHGSADADSHKRLPRVEKSRERLWMEDLLPFRSYIGAGLSAIMTAHVYVPALDSVEKPATVSPRVLEELLRKEMEFGGLIVTDAMNMGGVEGSGAVDAIAAGADIILAPADTHGEIVKICNAVRAGRLPLAQLRGSVRRVLNCKYAFLVKQECRRNPDRDEAARIGKKLLE